MQFSPQQYWRDFVSLFYPACCVVCADHLVGNETYLCTGCARKLPYTDFHDHPQKSLLAQRFWGKVEIEYALAYLYFIKKGKVQKLIHQLKYKGASELGSLMGNWYGTKLAEAGYSGEFDVVTPVPLHPRKLRLRGYNQAAGFAEALSLSLNARYSEALLVRHKFSNTQTHKSRYDRWENVAQIFGPHPQLTQLAAGKHILLADDVVTTGSTLEACAHLLLREGKARQVSIAAIAAAV